uniref:ATP synthase subunit a n=1 Tax=Muraenolepis orangiensis TaxID=630683 RepID=A0A6M4AIL7_9TELE|nr:ATP synthase F0 subunit 6 [Muraenolepis orangiensis]
MTLSIFDQFSSPVWLGTPLILIALMAPVVLFYAPTPRWLDNRLQSLQGWLVQSTASQLMLPLNTGGHKWALLLISLLMFLLGLNTLGLLPYTFTPTTQLSLNLGLAVPLWLATVLIGARNQLNHTLAHFLPEGTPTALIPSLVIIETMSLFIRPIALGVRITANLTAGHLLIHLISWATISLITTMPTIALFTATLLLMLTLLEMAVALIQAYVFVLLLTLYLQENT